MYTIETKNRVYIFPNDIFVKRAIVEHLDEDPTKLANTLTASSDFIFDKIEQDGTGWYVLVKDRTFVFATRNLAPVEFEMMTKLIEKFYEIGENS